jgi:hypothetical protein
MTVSEMYGYVSSGHPRFTDFLITEFTWPLEKIKLTTITQGKRTS